MRKGLSFMLNSLKWELRHNHETREQHERHLYCNDLCSNRRYSESVWISRRLSMPRQCSRDTDSGGGSSEISAKSSRTHTLHPQAVRLHRRAECLTLQSPVTCVVRLVAKHCH